MLVALNSVFQVLMFAVLGWFYLSVLPGWLGLEQTTIDTSPWQIAKSVLIFLGIPLIAGYLTRRIGERARGREWYESSFLPRLGPWALYGLLFTIVILFALQGRVLVERPLVIAMIAVPILLQSYGIFAVGYAAAWLARVPFRIAAPCALIGTSNFFELAVAVAISIFGLNSGAALATVVGVLVEVPVMLTLVAFANRTRSHFPAAETTADAAAPAAVAAKVPKAIHPIQIRCNRLGECAPIRNTQYATGKK